VRKYFVSPAGQNEVPTRQELMDARKDLAKLIRERERLDSKTEQATIQRQKDELVRMLAAKAEIEAAMAPQGFQPSPGAI
jgi:hypothetical protein